MEKGRPHVEADLDCPIFKTSRHVEFAVNVFRSAEDQGLVVDACSEFHGNHGVVACETPCTHTPEALRLHETEAQKHLEELALIGTNVIG